MSTPTQREEGTSMEPVVFTPISAVANLKRSTVIGLVLGAIAIVLTSLEHHPWMGAFGLVGILMGAGNNFLLQQSVLRFAANANVTRKHFGGAVLVRLGGVTALALAIAVLDHPDGLGVFVGMAVFQLLMLIGAAVPVMRYLRPQH